MVGAFSHQAGGHADDNVSKSDGLKDVSDAGHWSECGSGYDSHGAPSLKQIQSMHDLCLRACVCVRVSFKQKISLEKES